MFLRFLGRIFLYFVIVPTVAPFINNTLKVMLKNWIDKQYATMTPEQKKRFDRTSPYIPSPKKDHTRPSTPMGFQAH